MSRNGSSFNHENTSRQYLQCPYQFEIIEGRVFVDGIDEGEAETFFNEGRKLIRYVDLLDQVKRS